MGSDFLSARGFEGAECVRCIQAGLIKQYVESAVQGETLLGFVLAIEPGPVTGVSVGEHVGNSGHNNLEADYEHG